LLLSAALVVLFILIDSFLTGGRSLRDAFLSNIRASH
jgi:hypothetical protein